jgi:hypothetical protein
MKLAFLVLAVSFGATQAKDVVRGGGRALQGEFSMSMAGFEAADEEPVDYPTEFPTLSKSSKSTKSSKFSKCLRPPSPSKSPTPSPSKSPTPSPSKSPTPSPSKSPTPSPSKSPECGSPPLLSLQEGQSQFFSIEVPASKAVACFLSGDNGDGDLYLFEKDDLNNPISKSDSVKRSESVTSFGAVENYDRSLKVKVGAAQSFASYELGCLLIDTQNYPFILSNCPINLIPDDTTTTIVEAIEAKAFEAKAKGHSN